MLAVFIAGASVAHATPDPHNVPPHNTATAQANAGANASAKGLGIGGNVGPITVQGGHQEQEQQQAQEQKATATGIGTANNAGVKASSGANGNTTTIENKQVRQTPMAYAPTIYQNSACGGPSQSTGVATGLISFSHGTAEIDRECQINNAELTLKQLSVMYGEEAAADMAIRIRCKSELLGINEAECRVYRDMVQAAVQRRAEVANAEANAAAAAREKEVADQLALLKAQADQARAEKEAYAKQIAAMQLAEEARKVRALAAKARAKAAAAKIDPCVAACKKQDEKK